MPQPNGGEVAWSFGELEGLAVSVQSAGLSAAPGHSIAKHTATILDRRKISHQHSSQIVSDNLVGWADLILPMTFSHKQMMIQRFPYALDKIHLLKEYLEDDPHVLAAIVKSGQLYSELELKMVLSQEITAEERQSIQELEKRVPDFDGHGSFRRFDGGL